MQSEYCVSVLVVTPLSPHCNAADNFNLRASAMMTPVIVGVSSNLLQLRELHPRGGYYLQRSKKKFFTIFFDPVRPYSSKFAPDGKHESIKLVSEVS